MCLYVPVSTLELAVCEQVQSGAGHQAEVEGRGPPASALMTDPTDPTVDNLTKSQEKVFN